jgi:hypothetical protein
MIIRAIENSIKHAKQKKWDKTFWAFDLHGTILVPNYKGGQIPTEFYPFALETLQMISKMPSVCMIMYTCSHPHEIEEYKELFKSNNILFEHFNNNPEVVDGAYGYYKDKFYFNVLFEDKAGFDPSEWPSVNAFIQENYDFTNNVWKDEVVIKVDFLSYLNLEKTA